MTEPAWKRQGGKAARPKLGEATDYKEQAKGRSTAGQRPWWTGKGFRVGAISAGLLFLAVLGVVVYLWFRPKPPPQWILIGADYTDNLAVPENVAGWRGLHKIKTQKWAADSPVPIKLESARSIKDAFDPATKSRADKLVVVVAAHGIAVRDDDGKLVPKLVPQNYDPGNPRELIDLDELLGYLRQFPQRQKVLLLDVATIHGHWPTGQFLASFAEAMHSAEFRAKIDDIPNLNVLVSADKGQPSWVASQWGTTAFAHAVIEGVNGAADKDGNKGITVGELLEHVKADVKRWTNLNRDRVQEPWSLGKGNSAEILTRAPEEAYQRPAPPETDVAALKGRWKDCDALWRRSQELARAAAPPWRSPQVWRRYQDTLLRIEELVRAGDDSEAVGKLTAEARALADRLAGSGKGPGESLRLTLAMPDVAGAMLSPADEKWLDNFGRLLSTGGYALAEKEAREKKALTDVRLRRLLLTRAAEQLLYHVAASPSDRWRASRPLLEILDDLSEPRRSAEAHFLLMVNPDEKADSPVKDLLLAKQWPLVSKGLRTRLLAERAAVGLQKGPQRDPLPAASEEVLPWIRTRIAAADAERRLGEDLLFTSVEESWKQAEKYLDEATRLYQETQTDAAHLREALRQRDRALAELPYYTRWLAELPTPPGVDHEPLVKRAWDRVRELDKALSRPDETDRARPAALGKTARELQEALEGIRAKYREPFLNEHSRDVHDDWHEIDRLLRVPLLATDVDPDRRWKLIADLARISYRLHAEGERAQELRGGTRTPEVEEARRHARFALIMLGITDPEDLTGQPALIKAGERLAGRMAKLADDAQVKAEEADKEKTLPRSLEKMSEAAALARWVDGWAVGRRLKRDPVEEYRLLLLHQLLRYQAERTYLDFWAAEGRTLDGRQYYQQAGDLFLRDAQTLPARETGTAEKASPTDPRLEEWRQVEAKLKKAPDFHVEWARRNHKDEFRRATERLPLTDEKEKIHHYRVRGRVVPGKVVTWVEAKPGLDVPARQRDRRAEGEESFEVRITRTGNVEDPGPNRKTEHAVRAYFRGHKAAAVTEVLVYNRPDVYVVNPPPPRTARVAVRAKWEAFERIAGDHVAVSIVLDYSGSMTRKVKGENITRWKAATTALRNVVRQLPNGTQVSLRGFHSAGENDNAADRRPRTPLLWKRGPWSREDRAVERKMSVVEGEPRVGWTPLLLAMSQARYDFPEGFQGRRVMLVITDGADSYFHHPADPYTNVNGRNIKGRARTIRQFLQAQFGEEPHSGIEVHVIGINVDPNDLATKGEKQALADLERDIKVINGQWLNPANARALEEEIRRILLDMRFRVDAGTSRERLNKVRWGWISYGAPGTRTRGNLRWVDVEVGDHTEHGMVKIPSIPRWGQPIRLRGGDLLVLNLEPPEGDGRVPRVRRSRYHPVDDLRLRHWEFKRPPPPVDRWYLEPLQVQQANEGGRLRLMASIEKVADIADRDADVQLVRPRWVWFEVDQTSGPRGVRHPLRVYPRWGYPAPVWGMEVPDWPRAAPATMHTWWSPTEFPTHAPGLAPPRGQTLEALRERPWNEELDRTRGIVVERVERVPAYDLLLPRETHDSLIKSGIGEALVVHLRYPPGKGPFFVGLRDNKEQDWRGGEAHRWYHEAGKYTGIFWPVSEERLKELQELQLYSVDQLKKLSRTIHHTVDLGVPAENQGAPSRLD